MRETTTISTTSFSNKGIRFRQHCLLQYISIISVIICLAISACNAFQMTTTSRGQTSSSLQIMSNSRGSIMMSIPTSRLANQSNRIHSSSITTSRCSTYTSHTTGSCSQSNLFPQRSSSIRRSILQQMSDNNQVDNNEEGTNCPVTKLWLSFRKLLAKFWVSLLESYRTYDMHFCFCLSTIHISYILLT